jgi:hypothetical protein
MVKMGKFSGLVLLLGWIASPVAGQQSEPAKSPGPAESLYLKLRAVGLDKTRVYKIREAALDRGSLHITLDDGTIAFTEDAGGRITGAFFKGYGEVLVVPPNTMERNSMARFTNAAILEETFSTAYFRFNDDVYGELQPGMRSADDSEAFTSEWNDTVRNLAENDALRLLQTLSDSLPPEEKTASPEVNDHTLHAILQGDKLGTFDVWYDSMLPEQIAVAQHRKVDGQNYYDTWTSFAVPDPRLKASPIRREGEYSNPEFDVPSFKITAQINPGKGLDAKAILSVVARRDGRRALVFELSRLLQIKEVRADGHPVEFIHNQAIEGSQLARRGNDVVAVILPSRLRAGQKIQLSFEYSGAVLSEAASGLLYVGERGTWFPNQGFAMASFDMEFRYPPGWTLVATGRRVQEDRTDGPEQSSRWVSERPVPVAGFNLGKYSQTVTHAGDVAVLTYATSTVERGFPGTDEAPGPQIHGLVRPGERTVPLALGPSRQSPSPSQNGQMVGAASATAVGFYEKYFGPFPYHELALTQMPGRLSQGWPGLIFLSSYSFLSAEQRAQVESDPSQRLMSEQVIAHETAHQWWGDLVTWKGYRDQWIMEGLANYSALMLLELHDPAKFRQILQNYRDELVTKNRKGLIPSDAGPVTLGVRLSSSLTPDAYEAICYGRGTWLFHMLRTMMRDAERKDLHVAGRSKIAGDEPFLRALRKLRTKYEGKAVSTQQLMSVFESELPPGLWYEGHKSLDWFYEGWVNGSAVPGLDLRGLKFTDTGTRTLVSGTIIQEHAPDSLVTAVPLYAAIAGRNVFLGRVFAEGRESQFHLAAPAGVRKIVLDPERTILARK